MDFEGFAVASYLLIASCLRIFSALPVGDTQYHCHVIEFYMLNVQGVKHLSPAYGVVIYYIFIAKFLATDLHNQILYDQQLPKFGWRLHSRLDYSDL